MGRNPHRFLGSHRPESGKPGHRVSRRFLHGIFVDQDAWPAQVQQHHKWLSTIKLNTVERRDLTISLLDESHNPVMVWKALNAFPVKVEGPALKASGNEVAIESIELAHEGLEVQNG
jgi:phage tail-like protein